MSYDYSARFRTPLTLICFIFMAGLSTYGYLYGAPWYWLAIVIIPGIFLGWQLWVNPRFALSVSRSEVQFSVDDKQVELAAGDIDHFIIEDWSDTTEVAAILKDGRKKTMPSYCYKNSVLLETELTKYGYQVKRI